MKERVGGKPRPDLSQRGRPTRPRFELHPAPPRAERTQTVPSPAERAGTVAGKTPAQRRLELLRAKAPPKETGKKSPATSKQVIYASDPEFERITRYSDRSLASGKYIVRWIDDKNRLHLQGNDRLTTVGWDGKERTDRVFDRPPTFEDIYEGTYMGRVNPKPDHENDQLYAYNIGFNLHTRLGRRSLRRFLEEAGEAGYDVRRHQADRKDTVQKDEATLMTFILSKRPEQATPAVRTPTGQQSESSRAISRHPVHPEQTVFDRAKAISKRLEEQLKAALAKEQLKQRRDESASQTHKGSQPSETSS